MVFAEVDAADADEAEAPTDAPPLESDAPSLEIDAPPPEPMEYWLVACERCGIDRRIPCTFPLPRPSIGISYWYCELNP